MKYELGQESNDLPLVLWNTPPGLELALRQEGVPIVIAAEAPAPARLLASRAGRFVLFDGRNPPPRRLPSAMSPIQVAIDVDAFRSGEAVDPFDALVDTQGAPMAWRVEGLKVVERMSRFDKGSIRRRLVDRVRRDVCARGGTWARASAFPHPFRSAFNLRVDLDEPSPDDYWRFAEARRPIDDCSTHFVSTAAYARFDDIMADLLRVDAQSHGHFHHVYRDEEANRRNLLKARSILSSRGFHPLEGFAAPHGRWNPGLDAVMEELGASYSSDFQLGYDDRPMFPWLGDRFSKVLQVPVHPLCEGAFFEAGGGPEAVLDHLVGTVRRRIDQGEPAFVYGHPEARLGRYPRIVSALAEAVEGEHRVWRTSLTRFARWWRWRLDRQWSMGIRPDGSVEIRVAGNDPGGDLYPWSIEIVRGDHASVVPIGSDRIRFDPSALAFEKRPARVDPPEVSPFRGPIGLKAAFRRAIDWETATPVDQIDASTFSGYLKKQIRRWKG